MEVTESVAKVAMSVLLLEGCVQVPVAPESYVPGMLEPGGSGMLAASTVSGTVLGWDMLAAAVVAVVPASTDVRALRERNDVEGPCADSGKVGQAAQV